MADPYPEPEPMTPDDTRVLQAALLLVIRRLEQLMTAVRRPERGLDDTLEPACDLARIANVLEAAIERSVMERQRGSMGTELLWYLPLLHELDRVQLVPEREDL